MSLGRFWLACEHDGVQIVSSAARVASGNSGNLTVTTLLGENLVVCAALIVGVDITVQGGTQASVDFDLMVSLNGFFARVDRKNVTPASGVQSFVLTPRGSSDNITGTIPFVPETYRLDWTFNTPGATPTVTFSARAAGWGYRNIKTGFPGMKGT